MTIVYEANTCVRRSDDDRIAELIARIEGVRQRGERKKRRAVPAVKLTVRAVRLLDNALNATQEAVARKVIEDARHGLGAYVATQGWTVPTVGVLEALKKPGRQLRAA